MKSSTLMLIAGAGLAYYLLKQKSAAAVATPTPAPAPAPTATSGDEIYNNEDYFQRNPPVSMWKRR
jgi:hypothetical protein